MLFPSFSFSSLIGPSSEGKIKTLRPKSQLFYLLSLVIGGLSKDDCNDDARKQWSDWLNEEKQSYCTCRTHFSAILWRSLPNDIVNFPNLPFQRRHEHTPINLSFSIFTLFNGASTSPFAAFFVNDKGCAWGRSNNHNEKNTISQMFIFKWRFRYRCRRY